MLKFMSAVCSREGISVDKSTLESIAAASGGDIRCAINTLEFKFSEGTNVLFYL
jgi:DNA polymerase III delta prime subunit